MWWVALAEATGELLDNVKSNVGTAMTATAVVSAMRIRTAPPFVGRVHAPGSARCGRAPAIAFAPRTASGKASSVLAHRRRVCGRLCTAPGLGSRCRPRLRGLDAPGGRRVATLGMSAYVRSALLVSLGSRNSARHAAQKSDLIFASHNVAGVLRRATGVPNGPLTWGVRARLCDEDHKGPGGRGVFETIGNVRVCSISEKKPLTSSNGHGVSRHFGLRVVVQRHRCAA